MGLLRADPSFLAEVEAKGERLRAGLRKTTAGNPSVKEASRCRRRRRRLSPIMLIHATPWGVGGGPKQGHERKQTQGPMGCAVLTPNTP